MESTCVRFFECWLVLSVCANTRIFSCCLFFFFFQAEDGIRDVAVTGVQTCALPISKSLLPASSALVIVILSCGSQPLGTGCRELLSVAQSRHTSTPLLPTIEFP